MPRIRTVKPRLFQHSGLFDAEHDTGLPLRLAYIGLFTCCDREGRFKWDARELKLHILPWDELDFSRVLDALTTRGFVIAYASSTGEKFGAIPKFTHHQVINNRESASEIPPPPESLIQQAIATREPRVDDARTTRTQGKGREGKGKEGKGKEGNKTKPTKIPLNFDIENALHDANIPPTAWNAFADMRNRQRKPMTPHAIKLILAKVAELANAGFAPVDLLNQSIEHGWLSVYPIKGVNGGTHAPVRTTEQRQRTLAGLTGYDANATRNGGDVIDVEAKDVHDAKH